MRLSPNFFPLLSFNFLILSLRSSRCRSIAARLSSLDTGAVVAVAVLTSVFCLVLSAPHPVSPPSSSSSTSPQEGTGALKAAAVDGVDVPEFELGGVESAHGSDAPPAPVRSVVLVAALRDKRLIPLELMFIFELVVAVRVLLIGFLTGADSKLDQSAVSSSMSIKSEFVFVDWNDDDEGPVSSGGRLVSMDPDDIGGESEVLALALAGAFAVVISSGSLR